MSTPVYLECGVDGTSLAWTLDNHVSYVAADYDPSRLTEIPRAEPHYDRGLGDRRPFRLHSAHGASHRKAHSPEIPRWHAGCECPVVETRSLEPQTPSTRSHHAMEGYGRLVEAVRPLGHGRFDADLRLSTAHPFHFEHPLDHVPGLYLLDAGHQALEDAIRQETNFGPSHCAFAARFRVRFRRFAELRGPLTLHIDLASLGRSFDSRACLLGPQGVLGEGTSTWRVLPTSDLTDSSSAPSRPIPKLPAPPLWSRVPREIVHKSDDGNVLLDELAADPDEPGRFWAWARPALDHPFFAPEQIGGYTGLFLIEAGRQLGEALCHRAFGVPLDAAFVMDELDVALHARAHLGDRILVSACCRNHENRHGALHRMTCEFTMIQSRREIFSARARWRILPRGLYRRLREGAA